MPGFVVHKHPLAIDRDNHVRVPWGADFIHFDFQDRTPTVWSLKPTNMSRRGWQEVTLRIVGTGWEDALEDTGLVPPLHIGTALVDWLVWHLFVVDCKDVEHG